LKKAVGILPLDRYEDTRLVKAFVLAILFGVCVSLTAQSNDKPAASQPASAGLEAIQTANSLAKYGYSNYSASALIVAAEILGAVQTQPLDAAPTTDSSESSGADAKTGKPEFTPANLLADAKKYASGDSAMLAWAAKV
jgi:hypothetical protein